MSPNTITAFNTINHCFNSSSICWLATHNSCSLYRSQCLPGEEYGALSQHIIIILDIFTNCVMANLIGGFGVFGNIINIIVLRRHGFKESTNIILFSLSISDLLFSAIAPLTKLSCIVRYFDEALAITVNTFGVVYLYMPTFVFLANSFTLIAVIAIERFTAVHFPFKVSRIFSVKVIKSVVTVVAILSLLLISPNFFAYRYEWVFDGRYKKSVAVVRSTQFYETNKKFLDTYMWIGMNNVFCTLSMTIVLVCCLAIGIRLYRAASKREKMTSRSTGYDVKVVKMLVVVCVVYLCVQVPSITLYIYLKPDYIVTLPATRMAIDMTELLYSINASANFLIYVSMSEKFANTYRNLLGLKTNKPSARETNSITAITQ